MKSSYKLYGVFWDHCEEAAFEGIKALPFTNGIDYRSDFSLYDLLGMYRTIKISELLSVERDEEWNSICFNLERHSKIAVVIDYVTSPESRIACSFYRKRVSQIYYALKQRFRQAEIVVQVPDENKASWQNLKANDS
ncbi:MAG: HEPN domain-containing protein [Clostridiales bacterium]|nr:HEPN domain-containing protein [Clostridiales bacterium]